MMRAAAIPACCMSHAYVRPYFLPLIIYDAPGRIAVVMQTAATGMIV